MSFEANIHNLNGTKGEAWLASLPHRIIGISQTYKLSNQTPASNLSNNYVTFGFQNDQPIVLKLGINASEIKYGVI
jgi:streptomycin 6-kinase